MELTGTHGTSVALKAEIASRGFVPTRHGRGGPGVYVWRSGRLAEQLARKWYEQRLAEGAYGTGPGSKGIIVHVHIRLDDDEYLNLESPDVKDEIVGIALQQGLDTRDSSKLSALYDAYVKSLEKATEKFIVVLELRVAWPKSWRDYPVEVAGAPVTYVIRSAERAQPVRYEPI